MLDPKRPLLNPIFNCQLTKYQPNIIDYPFTNLIVYVDLTRMTSSLGFSVWIYLQRRLTSNLCFQLRIRFPRKQVVPKLELKHSCLQIAAKAQLPEYTTTPVSNCPIVQCQSPNVHFPESSNHQLQTRSPQVSLVVNSCFSYSSRLRSDATTVAIIFDCCANRITCCHFLVRKVPIVRLVLPALWFAPKVSTEALFKLRVTWKDRCCATSMMTLTAHVSFTHDE